MIEMRTATLPSLYHGGKVLRRSNLQKASGLLASVIAYNRKVLVRDPLLAIKGSRVLEVKLPRSSNLLREPGQLQPIAMQGHERGPLQFDVVVQSFFETV